MILFKNYYLLKIFFEKKYRSVFSVTLEKKNHIPNVKWEVFSDVCLFHKPTFLYFQLGSVSKHEFSRPIVHTVKPFLTSTQ